ncbi:MAG: response regulator transcription factor [Oligoflexia bacterium]|nr:response regulator transcription factor [Oligoflexia bacterium]
MNLFPHRILIIDDEIQIQRLLKSSFSAYNIKSIEAMTGKKGLELAITERPELIILDIGLPDMSGLDVLREIRKWAKTPIVILSVKDEEDTIVSALENGADDYMTKPFGLRELLARIKISFRQAMPEENILFTTGNLEVDLSSHIVRVKGKEISLTSTEFDLLRVFIHHAGKVVTHQQLLKEVWGPHSIESHQYVRVYVGHLRQKIEDNPQRPKLITTEIGVGYRMKIQSNDTRKF